MDLVIIVTILVGGFKYFLLILSIIYGMSSFPLTFIFFKMVIAPPTRLNCANHLEVEWAWTCPDLAAAWVPMPKEVAMIWMRARKHWTNGTQWHPPWGRGNGWQKPGISSDFNREQMQSLVIFWLKKWKDWFFLGCFQLVWCLLLRLKVVSSLSRFRSKMVSGGTGWWFGSLVWGFIWITLW